MSGRGAYRPKKASEIDAIEARRIAGGFTFEDLCAKADVSVAQYRRMRKSGLGFTRRIKALQMALRTLEQEKRREGDAFPFAVLPGRSGPGQKLPLAEPGSPGGAGRGTGSGAGSAIRSRT